MRGTGDSESQALEARIVACLPAASFEMETFCRLVAVTASREVPTAAVSCGDRPRLLVNPDFVDEFCRRDEHLFLLVMHELWHVILAHTTLYPRLTKAHNVAFDAVINAGLAQQFRSPEYRGFLDAVNPADAFPALLLRPPEGWPAAPRYPDVPPRVGQVLRQLYPPPAPDSDTQHAMPTYQEIVDLLDHEGGESGGTLLGDHGDPSTEERLSRSGALGEVVRDIVGRWPPPPFPLGGRDAGGDLRVWTTQRQDPAGAARRAFGRILHRLLGPRPGGTIRRRPTQVEVQGGSGVLPNARDRLAPARRRLGVPGTLWAQPLKARCRVPEPPRSTLVYLDVSGSMGSLLPHLVGLLVPYAATGKARVMQFSTAVRPLPLAELRQGKLRTTNGTGIDPVLRDALADRTARRILVLTDGYTGKPSADVASSVAARGLRVHVVLPAESAWKNDLAGAAASMTVLPPLERKGRS